MSTHGQYTAEDTTVLRAALAHIKRDPEALQRVNARIQQRVAAGDRRAVAYMAEIKRLQSAKMEIEKNLAVAKMNVVAFMIATVPSEFIRQTSVKE